MSDPDITAFQPVSVLRLYRMIANQIKDKIQSGVYRSGERLPSERELAEMLTVSRPSVREALIALEIEGYVDVRVGAGVFVTGPNEYGNRPDAGSTDAAAQAYGDVGPYDLLEARLLVEPACAELAAKNATPVQLAAIETAALALSGSAHPRQQDRAFHLAIAEASGNVALASTVLHLWNLCDASVIFKKLNQHFVFQEVWQKVHTEHEPIFRAIQMRKPLVARRAMQTHLTAIRDRLGLDASGTGNGAI